MSTREKFEPHMLPEEAKDAMGAFCKSIRDQGSKAGFLRACQQVVKFMAEQEIDEDVIDGVVMLVKEETGVTIDEVGEIVDADERGSVVLFSLAK